MTHPPPTPQATSSWPSPPPTPPGPTRPTAGRPWSEPRRRAAVGLALPAGCLPAAPPPCLVSLAFPPRRARPVFAHLFSSPSAPTPRFDQDAAYDFLKAHGMAVRAFGERRAGCRCRPRAAEGCRVLQRCGGGSRRRQRWRRRQAAAAVTAAAAAALTGHAVEQAPGGAGWWLSTPPGFSRPLQLADHSPARSPRAPRHRGGRRGGGLPHLHRARRRGRAPARHAARRRQRQGVHICGVLWGRSSCAHGLAGRPASQPACCPSPRADQSTRHAPTLHPTNAQTCVFSEIKLYGDCVLRFVSGDYDGPFLPGWEPVPDAPRVRAARSGRQQLLGAA